MWVQMNRLMLAKYPHSINQIASTKLDFKKLMLILLQLLGSMVQHVLSKRCHV